MSCHSCLVSLLHFSPMFCDCRVYSQVDETRRIARQEMADDPSGCSCGSGNRIEPFVPPWVAATSGEKEASEKYTEEKHFVFSSNRSSLSPSDYKDQ
ncbi:hypothetical protein AVEN_162305-1 [Araneus ventricosus]|uniref:Uncharacterized protein n=1 Tax=Araneus ventricosus TaxID=182803 RepID=A0A4Y2LWT2_ARAVE|nr:hypothetical protein AVEN_162305-1 [Araneus ventricosus]